MTEQTNKKYGVMVKAATLSVALLMYTTSMTTPALAEIAKAFPDASGETVKLIGSIPSLMLCIFSLVSGWLTRKVSIIKAVLIASGLIFAGVLPAFFGDMNFILFTRVVFGAGYGLVFPLASAVVTDLFDGSEKDAMMGWKSAVGALAGVVFQSLGGILAAYSWRFSFLGFLLVIPIVILVLFVLPDTGFQIYKNLIYLLCRGISAKCSAVFLYAEYGFIYHRRTDRDCHRCSQCIKYVYCFFLPCRSGLCGICQNRQTVHAGYRYSSGGNRLRHSDGSFQQTFIFCICCSLWPGLRLYQSGTDLKSSLRRNR